MTILEKLKQPFPYSTSYKTKLGMAAFFGVFVFLFLLIFQPFELDRFTAAKLFLNATVYSVITFSCVFSFTSSAPLLLPKLFEENAWTTGKQILFTAVIIFFVGLTNYLASSFLFHTDLNLSRAIWFQGITLAIGIIPVSIFILLRQNRLLKKFTVEAEQLEKKLQEKQELEVNTEQQSLEATAKKIVLVGNYQNEKLEIYPDDLHLITSASNYIKIYHIQKGKLTYSIIRSTLKKAEEALVEFPHFFKCHRAFIINLNKVSHE